VFNTSRQLGGALAIAVFGAFLAQPAGLAHGVRVSLAIAAAGGHHRRRHQPPPHRTDLKHEPAPDPIDGGRDPHRRERHMTTRTTADLTTIGTQTRSPSPQPGGAPTMTDTTDNQPSGAQRMIGDFAAGLVGVTDDVLFGQVWTRPDLSPKERSLITVACLTTSGNTNQLVFHLDHARRNGNTEAELIEAITHLAFYRLAQGDGRHGDRQTGLHHPT
jgi:4-carboxymuconolactone decarboxylase